MFTVAVGDSHSAKKAPEKGQDRAQKQGIASL